MSLPMNSHLLNALCLFDDTMNPKVGLAKRIGTSFAKAARIALAAKQLCMILITITFILTGARQALTSCCSSDLASGWLAE